MAVLEQEVQGLEADEPRPFLWTKAQYHRMRELGWFVDTAVELLEGDVMEMYPDTPSGEPRRMSWTKEQYYEMGWMDWFTDVWVELMGGEVYETPAISAGHWKATILVGKVMRRIFDAGYTVAEQTSFDGGENPSLNQTWLFTGERYGISTSCPRSPSLSSRSPNPL